MPFFKKTKESKKNLAQGHKSLDQTHKQKNLEQILIPYFQALNAPRIDTSSFILLALAILNKVLDDSLVTSERNAILEDFLNHDMEGALNKIKTICEKHPVLMQSKLIPLMRKRAFTKNDEPMRNPSRRFWESRLCSDLWNELTHADVESINKFALLVKEINPNLIKTQEITTIEQVEALFLELREFGEQTPEVKSSEEKFREGSAINALKDRKRKEPSPSSHPGILKSTDSCPPDLLYQQAKGARVVDSYSIKEQVKDGFSASHKGVPFVASISGTIFTFSTILRFYMEKHKGEKNLEQDVNRVLKSFMNLAVRNGYHGLHEMHSILKAPEVAELYANYNVKINFAIPARNMWEATLESAEYAKKISLQDTVHKELLSSGVENKRLFRQQHLHSIGMRENFLPESLSQTLLQLKDNEGNFLTIHGSDYIKLKKYLKDNNLAKNATLAENYLKKLNPEQLLSLLEQSKVRVIKYFSNENLKSLVLMPETTSFDYNAEIKTVNGINLVKGGHTNCVAMFQDKEGKISIHTHPKIVAIPGNLQNAVLGTSAEEKTNSALLGVHHSSLAFGKKVQFAGSFVHKKDIGWYVENFSGHYITRAYNLALFLQNLQDQGFNLQGLKVKIWVPNSSGPVTSENGYIQFEEASAFLRRTNQSKKQQENKSEVKQQNKLNSRGFLRDPIQDQVLQNFLLAVAFGDENVAESLLKNKNAEWLLNVGTFTDYSGRTFNCSAYEYAYWAKDTQMCRMIEKYMDDSTKEVMLQRINKMENIGLHYQQNGKHYQFAHFDFTPLTQALQTYSNGYNEWIKTSNWSAMEAAWKEVGLAQREVPAHVAQEYCQKIRPFQPCPMFEEQILTRDLTFYNGMTDTEECWFPLEKDSGIGYDFALIRSWAKDGVRVGSNWDGLTAPSMRGKNPPIYHDLVAVSKLDEVRSNELILSRKFLETTDNPRHTI